MTRAVHCLTAACLSIATFGCGGGSDYAEPEPVSGTILYEGKPVDEARVSFLWSGDGSGRSASGKTDSEGKFELTTFSTGDGAIPGEYTVTVSKADPATQGADVDIDAETGEYGADYGAMMDAAASGSGKTVSNSTILPEKYADPAESGIQRSVVEGQRNEFTIELD